MTTTTTTTTRAAEWRQSLKTDQYIDALDTAKEWSEAVVIGLTQHKVHIHYRGWVNKYNEWLPRDSPRLAPAYSRVQQWRALKKGDPVELGTVVSGRKTPPWRRGVVAQVRHAEGKTASAIPACVQVQLEGDGETRWMDPQEDFLCEPGAHLTKAPAPKRRAAAKQDNQDDSSSDEEKSDASKDEDGQVLRRSTRSAKKKRKTSTPVGHKTKTKPKRKASQDQDQDDDDDDDEEAEDSGDGEDTFVVVGDEEIPVWRMALCTGAEVEVTDAKLQKWYEARVVDAHPHDREVCVRYRGWPWRYDEWLPVTSDRLAPSGRHLGRWRKFKMNQQVQVGFRARPNGDTATRWLVGDVVGLGVTKKTRKLRRIKLEVDEKTADGESTILGIWRDVDDDFLAPLGAETYPLPKNTMRGGPSSPTADGDDHMSSEEDGLPDQDQDQDQDGGGGDTSDKDDKDAKDDRRKENDQVKKEPRSANVQSGAPLSKRRLRKLQTRWVEIARTAAQFLVQVEAELHGANSDQGDDDGGRQQAPPAARLTKPGSI